MYVPPIVAQCLERPHIQTKLAAVTTPEQKAALAEEVHALLPFPISVVVKQDFIADLLDDQTFAKLGGSRSRII